MGMSFGHPGGFLPKTNKHGALVGRRTEAPPSAAGGQLMGGVGRVSYSFPL